MTVAVVSMVLYWLKKLLHFERDSATETYDKSKYYRYPIKQLWIISATSLRVYPERDNI